eukprot:scaffold95375_cov36-Phaeocystis_antarctica.AAC.1
MVEGRGIGLWRRIARAPEAVASRPSVAPPRAARRALRRRSSQGWHSDPGATPGLGREKDLASTAPVKAPSCRRSLTALVTAFCSAASSAARCTRMRWYAVRVALSSASRSALHFLRVLRASSMPTSRSPRPESVRARERQLHLLAEQPVIGRDGQADRGIEDAQLGVERRRVGGRRRAERGEQLGHLDRCLIRAVLRRDEEVGDRGLHLLLRLVAAEHVDDVVPDVLVQLHEEPVACTLSRSSFRVYGTLAVLRMD